MPGWMAFGKKLAYTKEINTSEKFNSKISIPHRHCLVQVNNKSISSTIRTTQ